MQKICLIAIALGISLGCQPPEAKPIFNYDRGVFRVVNMLESPLKVSINGKVSIEAVAPLSGSNALRAKVGPQKIVVETGGASVFDQSVDISKTEPTSLYFVKKTGKVEAISLPGASVLASDDKYVSVRVVNLSSKKIGPVKVSGMSVGDAIEPGKASEVTEVNGGDISFECKDGAKFEFRASTGPKEAYEIVVTDTNSVLVLCSSRRKPSIGVPSAN